MVADLREMQENQGFSEIRIDKLEFVVLSNRFFYYLSASWGQRFPCQIQDIGVLKDYLAAIFCNHIPESIKEC